MDKLVENPIVGIDIGASKISAIIGEVEESGNIKVICNCEEALEIGVASDLQTTVETLKKVVFNLQFKMAMKKSNPDEVLEISKKAQEIQRKIDALIKEIEESNGQVGFAFSELIDVTKIKNEKGKK